MPLNIAWLILLGSQSKAQAINPAIRNSSRDQQARMVNQACLRESVNYRVIAGCVYISMLAPISAYWYRTNNTQTHVSMQMYDRLLGKGVGSMSLITQFCVKYTNTDCLILLEVCCTTTSTPRGWRQQQQTSHLWPCGQSLLDLSHLHLCLPLHHLCSLGHLIVGR